MPRSASTSCIPSTSSALPKQQPSLPKNSKRPRAAITRAVSDSHVPSQLPNQPEEREVLAPSPPKSKPIATKAKAASKVKRAQAPQPPPSPPPAKAVGPKKHNAKGSKGKRKQIEYSSEDELATERPIVKKRPLEQTSSKPKGASRQVEPQASIALLKVQGAKMANATTLQSEASTFRRASAHVTTKVAPIPPSKAKAAPSKPKTKPTKMASAKQSSSKLKLADIELLPLDELEAVSAPKPKLTKTALARVDVVAKSTSSRTTLAKKGKKRADEWSLPSTDED